MRRASFKREITAATARFEALDASVIQTIADRLLPSVVTWRWSVAGSGAHRTEPWWQARNRISEDGGGWLPERDAGADADRVGSDVEGRVLMVEEHRGAEASIVEVWEHDEAGATMSRVGPSKTLGVLIVGEPSTIEEDRAVVILDRWADPRRATTVRTGDFFTEDGQQRLTQIEEWSWQGGTATAGEALAVEGDGAWYRSKYVLEPGDVMDRLVVDGFPIWFSEPVLREESVVVDALAAGLERALRAGVAASGVDRPFIVEYRTGSDESYAPLPGFARVGSEAFREATRKANSSDGAAVDLLYEAPGRADGASFDLGDFLDDDAALACAELNAATAHVFSGTPAMAAFAQGTYAAVAERLTRRLNEPGIFGVTADPFLASIRMGVTSPDDAEVDALGRRILGDEVLDRFAVSVASKRPKSRGRKVSVKAARTDRKALAAWLESAGIPTGLSIAKDVAQPAFRLASPRRGRSKPRTRLHGGALLPPGEAWPRTAEGRDLAFVAGIDLSELTPSFEGGPSLPEAGWLLFYIDIENRLAREGEDGDEIVECSFYGEPTPNKAGSQARVFFLSSGVEPAEATVPPSRAGARGWPEERRAPQHELTLPDDDMAGDRLGLNAGAADEYSGLVEQLRRGPGHADRDDWILGAATGVQGLPVEDGSVLILHLASIEFQDGGAIQFRIPPEALAAGDWNQAYAVGDSG